MNPNLVVFLGVQGSGKNYQCNLLKKEGYTQFDFADELRRMSWDILDWEPRSFKLYDRDYDWFKKLPISYIHLIHYSSDTELELLYNQIKQSDKQEHGLTLTGRVFLQRLGTKAIRARQPDFWVDCWFFTVRRLLHDGFKICTSDCRFLNEFEAAKKLGAQFIFCNYKSSRYNSTDPDESEQLAQSLLQKGYSHGQEILTL